MSLADGQLNADGTITWTIPKAAGNVIGIQELPIGSTSEWVDAPVIAQLPKTATSYTPSSTGVMVHVTQLQFEAGALTINVPAPAPPPPPPPSGAVVSAAPLGLSIPPPELKVLFADGFAQLDTTLWVPMNSAGFNSDEVEVFHPSQIVIDGNGVNLIAEYAPNAGNAQPWISGYLNCAPGSNTVRPSGFKGFNWKVPITDDTIIFEMVCTLPSEPGEDCGWWAWQNGPGSATTSQCEIDFFECWNYGQNEGQAVNAWFGNDAGNSNSFSNAYASHYDTPETGPQHDGQEHIWTTVFNGGARTVQMLVDREPFPVSLGSGSDVTTNPVPYPAYSGSVGTPWAFWQQVMLSHALRNVGSGPYPGPISTNSPTSWTIRSHVVYGTPGCLTLGGGLAAGTTVA